MIKEKSFFDKKAKWISDGTRFIADLNRVGSPAIYFLKKINLAKISKATARICGLGLFELYINQMKVSDRVLEPAFTQYDKRVLFTEFQVETYLKEGENSIEVILGDGWYNQTTQDTWGFNRAAWRDNPKFIFQLITDTQKIYSDESWQVGSGPIISNAIRAGEVIDARIEIKYKNNAKIVAPPGGKICEQDLPPIRECETFKPVTVKKFDDYVLFDFGQTMAGYCSAYILGKRGEAIDFIYSDRLTNGRCDNSSNAMYIFNENLKYQTDTVILSDEEYFYKPKFVYHGFRYVEVRGNVQIRDITAYFVRTDLQKIGDFECSNETLNTLYRMSINAILSNYHGFPTDCPHREKNGWTGDAQLSAETCIYNFDMHKAYRKWLMDFVDNQRESGQISAIIPSCGWGYNWGSGPAWDIALFKLAYALYYYYGDIEIIEITYPVMKKYLEYASCYESKENLVCYGLGDWNYPQKITFDVCPTELTDSCFYAEMYSIVAKISEIFQPEKTQEFLEKENNIRSAIKNKYSNEKSLTGLSALHYYNIIDKSDEIAKYLEKNKCEQHCGILGTRFLMVDLIKMRRSDLAFKYLTRSEYPSFMYWAKNGQTCLCEDFEMTNSLNHHMYSCIVEYIMKGFCGINLYEKGKKVVISPDVPEQLNSFNCKVGGICVNYNKTQTEKYKIVLPVGCEGEFRKGEKVFALKSGENHFKF